MIPFVSIVIPCYNEEKTISALLKAISAQSYPLSRLEVVIADGFSKDQTRAVITDFQKKNPTLKIRVVDNPKRIIPAGVNAAVRASKGEILIRLDGHSKPRPDYVNKCVTALMDKLGDNVGGVWEIKPSRDTWLATSIARAAAHPLGVGDAQYRLGGQGGLWIPSPSGRSGEVCSMNSVVLMKDCWRMKTMSSTPAYVRRAVWYGSIQQSA